MRPKKLIRNSLHTAAVDDGRFITDRSSLRPQKAPFFCIVMNGSKLEKIKIREITVDGLDSTKILKGMLRGLKFNLIMLSGISFGGFNLIDVKSLFKLFRKPIIVISESKPRNYLVKKALMQHFKDWRKRLSYIKALGRIYCIKTVYNNLLYFEVIGLNYKKAKRIIRELTFIGKHPEPLRVVRLLAKDLN